MLKNYFKIALRNIRKYRGYSLINIFGLAIGITVCLIILMYVKHELSYDQYHKNADRIYRVNMERWGENLAVTPSMVAPTLEHNFPEVEAWVRLYEPTAYSPAVIRYGENIFQEDRFFYADSSFFDIFSCSFIAGTPETALNKPRSLVLTQSMAQKLVGDKNAVGEVVEARIFNSVINFEVTGIIEDVPENSHFTFDYMASLSTRSDWSQLTDSEMAAANFYTYLLLQDSSSKEKLEQKIPDIINKVASEEDPISLFLMPLTDIYLHSDLSNEIRLMGSMNNVLGFSALAFLVLIIAITNYINLATARSSRRASEVGIRKVLGANKAVLIRQFYGESMVITIFSVFIAIVLVEFFKEPFFNLLEKNVTPSFFSAPSTWIMLLVITLITAFIAGGYPALVLSSYQPSKVLKGLFISQGSDVNLRKGLVIFQFAISIFLILGTIVVYQQTDYILHKNLGFDKEQIVILPTGDNVLAPKHHLLKDEILHQPGVVSATYISNIPGRVFGGYTSEYAPLKQRVNTAAGAAGPDIMETLGLNLLAGKGFSQSPAYSVDQGYVYLINETLAKAYGWSPDEAIGKEFNVLGNRVGEVVGVVQDFNFASLRENIKPLALFIQPAMYDYLLVKISPENIPGSIASMEELWERMAPHRPFEFEFLDQELDALYRAEMQTRDIFTLFSTLAIFIACLGLVGLSSYMIERRTKEVGIRKVLGATVTNIVNLLSKDFIKLVLLGFVIAVPVAWYIMNRRLQDFAYRIEIGPGIFAIAGGAALLIAIVTVSWQSVKAALMNPVNSLRSE